MQGDRCFVEEGARGDLHARDHSVLLRPEASKPRMQSKLPGKHELWCPGLYGPWNPHAESVPGNTISRPPRVGASDHNEHADDETPEDDGEEEGPKPASRHVRLSGESSTNRRSSAGTSSSTRGSVDGSGGFQMWGPVAPRTLRESHDTAPSSGIGFVRSLSGQLPQRLAGFEQSASTNQSSVSGPAMGLEALPSFQEQMRGMEATFERLCRHLRETLGNHDHGP
jgi:hypothetical protein